MYEVASYRISTKHLNEEFNKRVRDGWRMVWQLEGTTGTILVTWWKD